MRDINALTKSKLAKAWGVNMSCYKTYCHRCVKYDEMMSKLVYNIMLAYKTMT
jgi:hypothetical protein